HIEHAGASEAGLRADLAVEVVPDPEALLDERDLRAVTVLLAAPAPVPARLLAGDPALLHERDGHAALRQVISGGRADDAAADDHGIGGFRQRGIALDGVDGWRHQGLSQAVPRAGESGCSV